MQFVEKAKEVHIEIDALGILDFMGDSSTRNVTCFRCGEQGHRKSECFNWKTKLCSVKDCPVQSASCPFAHDVSELRQPWVYRCMRVIKRDGNMYRVGCFDQGHTFSQCRNMDRVREIRIR